MAHILPMRQPLGMVPATPIRCLGIHGLRLPLRVHADDENRMSGDWWVDEIEHATIGDIRIVTPGRLAKAAAEHPVAKVGIAQGWEWDPVDLTADQCRTEAAKLLAAADILDNLQ